MAIRHVENIVNEIGKLATLNLRNPLSTLFTNYVGILIYEDMYHLVKCCRYRFVCGSRICPSLSKDDCTFGIEDFKLINIKDYVFDGSKSKKMDDNLPLLFFTFENIEAAIALKRYDLVLALLPCYLLINSTAGYTSIKRVVSGNKI